MRFVATLLLISQFSACLAQPAWLKKEYNRFTIQFTKEDELYANQLSGQLDAGGQTVTQYFQHPFNEKFQAFVFPHRADLDKQWQQDWGAPDFKSECWMVASGVATRLDLLSPNAWSHEACEHRADDAMAGQQLITHELVHVYHGQHNPKPTFEGLDDLAWIIEGVAVLVSGQLDEKRMSGVTEIIRSGKGPLKLVDVWKGNSKYGMGGSLMAFLEKKYGRSRIYSWLGMTSQAQILADVSMTEDELIKAWVSSIK